MYEVEVKVRADHETVRQKLADEGASSLGTVHQEDVYYDAPHRDFAKTDEAVRLRHEDGERTHTRITYKGPLVDAESKTRQEFETTVGDPDEMATILQELGFDPVASVEKRRERYDLDGYTVTLDTVERLGEFVEVERAADEAAVETIREGARDLLDRLDLDPREQIRRSYLELLLEAGPPRDNS